MRAIDFEYDNRYLSDYGFIIATSILAAEQMRLMLVQQLHLIKSPAIVGKNIVYQVRNMMNASPHL